MKTLFFLLTILMSNYAYAYALSGIETGNGSEYILVDGEPRLVDLLDKNFEICRWERLENLTLNMRIFQKGISSLHKLHWIFSDSLMFQRKDINVCFTKHEINSLNETEMDTPIMLNKSRQLAVRIKNKIFVAESIYKKLPQNDKQFLFIHELLHNYLDADEPFRKHKIRKMTKFIYENSVSLKTSKELSDLIIRQNFNIPSEAVSAGQLSKKIKFNFHKISNETMAYCESYKISKLLRGKIPHYQEYYFVQSDLDRINKLAEYPDSLILNSVKEGKLDIIKNLIENCEININEPIYIPKHDENNFDSSYGNILVLAVQFSQKHIFDYLIKKSATNLEEKYFAWIEEYNLEYNSISLAIMLGEYQMAIDLLANKSIDVNFQLNEGSGDFQNLFQILITELSDSLSPSYSDEARFRYNSLMQLLFKLIQNKDFSPNLVLKKKYFYPNLSWLLRKFEHNWHKEVRYKIFKELIKNKKLDINYLESDRWATGLSFSGKTSGLDKTPLMVMTIYGFLDELNLLLAERNDININQLNRNGHDALWYAINRSIENQDNKPMHILLSHPKLNIDNNIDGQTNLVKLSRLDGDNIDQVRSIFKYQRPNTKQKFCKWFDGKERCFNAYKWAKFVGNKNIANFLKRK